MALWELVGNTDSQALPETCGIGICISAGSLGDPCACLRLRHLAEASLGGPGDPPFQAGSWSQGPEVQPVLCEILIDAFVPESYTWSIVSFKPCFLTPRRNLLSREKGSFTRD